jgi:exosortase E/protease (VPEID-CTERM system)
LAAALGWRRVVLACGLLLGEYLFVSVSFSADALRQRSGWWGGLGLLDPLGAVLLVAVAASLLAAGTLVQSSGAVELSALLRTRHSLRPALLANAIAFALFAVATWYVFGAGFAAAALPGVWVTAWAVLAAAVLLSALAIALPLRSAAGVLVWLHRPLLIGGGVGLAAWAAGRATGLLWRQLSRVTFESAAAVLRLAGQRVVTDPDQFTVGIDDYVVTIAGSCVGYEGLGVIFVFLGAFLWLERRRLRFPRAWLLLPLGMAAVLAANVLRIALLIALGRWLSPAFAEGGFHSKAGWVMYCAIALGIAALARRSRFLARDALPSEADTWNPTAVYLGPLLALIATALATGLVSTDFDYLYPLRFVTVGAVLWTYRDRFVAIRDYWPSWESIGLGVTVFVVWLALEPRPDLTRLAAWGERFDAMPASAHAGWLVFRVLGSVIIVPIAEELAFRGYLLRRLISPEFTEVSARRFSWASFLLSSLAFGALHQRWLAGTIAGMGFALAQRRRGELGDAIVAHAVSNALIAADVLFLGAWWLWL